MEAVANVDESFADQFLLVDKPAPALELCAAVRRATTACTGVPLLCGSAYKNTAVQPLLDAVVDFLPGPDLSHGAEDKLAALAFKVVHTKAGTCLGFSTCKGREWFFEKCHNGRNCLK